MARRALLRVCSAFGAQAVLFVAIRGTLAWVSPASVASRGGRPWICRKASPQWMGYLKFGGSAPPFDVVEKTKEYTTLAGYRSFSLKDIPDDWYANDYVFRGPVVGPMNRKDLVQTNTNFEISRAFPDLDRQAFGFSVDPENPYRALWFERWKATHKGSVDFPIPGAPSFPATERSSVCPVFPFSAVWNPEGKIVYEHLGPAVDRFEGNTDGRVAVFGLFTTAGIPLPEPYAGNRVLALSQKLGRWLGFKVQTYSKRDDVPKWWKSTADAADPNDV